MMTFLEFYFAFACGFYLRPKLWGFVAWVKGNKHIDTIMYPVKKKQLATNHPKDEPGAKE